MTNGGRVDRRSSFGMTEVRHLCNCGSLFGITEGSPPSILTYDGVYISSRVRKNAGLTHIMLNARVLKNAATFNMSADLHSRSNTSPDVSP